MDTYLYMHILEYSTHCAKNGYICHSFQCFMHCIFLVDFLRNVCRSAKLLGFSAPADFFLHSRFALQLFSPRFGVNQKKGEHTKHIRLRKISIERREIVTHHQLVPQTYGRTDSQTDNQIASRVFGTMHGLGVYLKDI